MKFPGGTVSLDQLSVLDRWQGRGLGTALIDRTAAARELGHDRLYLSTYLGVPWNAPFYERRGFASVPRGEWPRAFRLQFMSENSHGHPPWRRTIMQRRVSFLRLGRGDVPPRHGEGAAQGAGVDFGQTAPTSAPRRPQVP